MLKIGDMLFCCNTDVIQNFVSFTFYDLWLNANWEEQKSSHCVFACTCMADYSILHERVCYLLYIKIVKLWVYVTHQILQQLTCHSHVLNSICDMCTKFGTNVGEMSTNSVTWFGAYLCKTEDTVNYVCCNNWCITCILLWPSSADTSKSAQVFIFCF